MFLPVSQPLNAENMRPQHASGNTNNTFTGKPVATNVPMKGVVTGENKENAMVMTRSSRSRASSLSASCGSTLLQTQVGSTGGAAMQQKARRVLQEIQAGNPSRVTSSMTETVSTVTTSTVNVAAISSSLLPAGASMARRTGASIASSSSSTSSLLSVVPAAAIPSFAALNVNQRATTLSTSSALSCNPLSSTSATSGAYTRSLSMTASSLLSSAAPSVFKSHVTESSTAVFSTVSSSHVPSTYSSAPSSALHVPPSFLSGNFTASALSTFCANSNVNALTAVQEKERELKMLEQLEGSSGMESGSHAPSAEGVETSHPMSTDSSIAVYVDPELQMALQDDSQNPMQSSEGLDADDADAIESDREAVDSSAIDVSLMVECSPAAMELCSSPAVAHVSPFGSVPLSVPSGESHLWTTEYTSDIMNYWFSSESIHAAPMDYLTHQPDLNSKMREILIDWLHEVVAKFRLQQETMFLAVQLLDRFLSKKAVGRKRLQLVGCVALLLAAKYEEIYIPEINDFITISDNAYGRDHILHMEGVMLNTLNFQLTQVSPYRFLQRFLNLPQADFLVPAKKAMHAAAQVGLLGSTHEDVVPTHLAFYLLELTLQFVQFLAFRPSTLAAAVLYVLSAHQHINREGENESTFVWNEALERETRHSESELRACVVEIYAAWQSMSEMGAQALASGNMSSGGTGNKCLAVYRKFAKEKYGTVSLIQLNKPQLIR